MSGAQTSSAGSVPKAGNGKHVHPRPLVLVLGREGKVFSTVSGELVGSHCDLIRSIKYGMHYANGSFTTHSLTYLP